MIWMCSVKTMGVTKVPDGGEKTMEVWYFCRYLPAPKVNPECCKTNGKMDPSVDTVEDDGGGGERINVNLEEDGGKINVNLDGSVFSTGQDTTWETQADISNDITADITNESSGMETSGVGGIFGGGGHAGGSVSGGDGSVEQQLVMIEEMVHEMKQGFVIAMEELTKIQEGDHNLQRRMQDHRESVDRIIKSFREQQVNQKSELLADIRKEIQEERERQQQPLGDMITALKNEVNTVSGHLREVLDLQKGLQEKVNVLHTERNILLEELVRNGAVSDKVRSLLHKNNGTSVHGVPEGQLPALGISGVDMTGSVEDEATASACKCLSLLQALEERCILPDLSDSSDEDIQSRSEHWQQNSVDGKSHRQNVSAPISYSDYQSQDTAERQQCVQDMIDSEREYCTQLWSLLDGYLGPLQDGLYISTRELNILFPTYLNQMYDEHCHILNVLEDRLQHWSWGGLVGDVFAKMTDTQTGNLISLYKEYLSDFPAAVACLRRQITQSRKFRAFIKREDRPNSGDIVSLLTAPIRRIPQYSLLLQQLLKNTPGSHPDHYTLQSTLSRLRSFVDQFSADITHIVSHDKDGTRPGAQSFRSSPSGSSCETGGQPASARDSGIHSNGEEVHPHHTYPTNRSSTPDWVEMTSNYPDSRGSSMDPRLSARSQPDLTFGRFSTSQLPSQSYKGDGIYQDGLNKRPPLSDKMSHHRRYKLKKKGDRQGGHLVRPGSSMSQTSLPPEYSTSYSLPQARHRPASAIDFISRHESSQLRHSREHLHSRPQSAMGMSSMHSGRNRSVNQQAVNRRFQDGGSVVMNRSMPAAMNSSQSSSTVHSIHAPLNSSFPVQRTFSPYAHESPRILVNGQRRESYPDSFHGGQSNSDFGVYGDEEHNLVSAHSLKYRDSNRHYIDNNQIGYSDDIELAVSLADSLNDHASPENKEGMGQKDDFETQDSSPSQDDRRSGLGSESVSNHNKSDRSMHASDLQLNLGQVNNSDTEETHVPKLAVYTDSSDQPNSSFEESVRSESRNSEQKTEESSDVVVTSQSQSPEHSSQTETAGQSSVTLTQNIPTSHAASTDIRGNNNSLLSFSNLQNPRIEPNCFENSVLSFDERMLSNHQTVEKPVTGRQQSDRLESRTRNSNRLSSPFPQSHPADYVPDLHTLPDETDHHSGRKEHKKKKEKTKRYNSMENLSKSSEDVNSKKTFKSSLKHFFGKKKGSVRMDKLEAQFAKEHGLEHIPTGQDEKGSNPLNNNNDTKIPLVKLVKEQDSSSTA